MFLFSLIVHGIVFYFGYHGPVEQDQLPVGAIYSGYFSKPNWYLDPIWFLILALVVHKSWDPFFVAWTTTLENPPVVSTRNKEAPTDEHISELGRDLTRHRKYIFFLALACSLVFNVIDIYPMAKIYVTTSAAVQLDYVQTNMHPDFFDKWLYLHPITSTVASPPLSQWIVFLFCYLQQFALVFLGFVALLQTIFHGVLFWTFPWPIPSATRHDLTINLNCNSVREDYGLTLWNRALDRLYLFMSLGYLVPITSRLVHGGPPNPGHVMVFSLLFILIISPGLFSIAARQRWAQIAEDMVKNNADAIKQCQANWIWPIDKNRLSKIWIIVSLALYVVYLTKEWSSVISLGKEVIH